jgi:hypothetical protein
VTEPNATHTVDRNVDIARLAALHPQVFATWCKYEDIAVHFNELMMRWRLQAIGGLLTLVTLAGFVVGDAPSDEARYRAMLILSATLGMAWMGVALIDLCYYRKLLAGAVDAIIDLEVATTDLRLSQTIDARTKPAGRWLPLVFYLCSGLPLLGIALYATDQLQEPRPRAAAISNRGATVEPQR